MEMMQKHSLKDGDFFYELEKYLNRSELIYKDSIKSAQNNLNSEKKKFLNVSLQKTSAFFEKSEMETIFLECIEEVRKEVIKRRAVINVGQKYTKRASSSHKAERSTLSPTDKQKILELLVSNEKVLLLIYEKLFPHRINHFQQPSNNEDNILPESNSSLEELLKQVPARLGIKVSAPQQRGRIFS